MKTHDEKNRQPGGSSAMLLVTITAFLIASVCLLCCGGLTLFYLAVPKPIATHGDAPDTSEPIASSKPLGPRELFDWYYDNRPSEPFVLHDGTRENVKLQGAIEEVNTGGDLRIGSMVERARTRLEDLDPSRRASYASWGESQLVFHGEQENQEVVCWFENAKLIEGLTVGQEVVVSGRIRDVESWSEEKGGFSMNLIRCRVAPH